jgi:hypothetical protein
MGKNIVEKIMAGHLVFGNLVPGEEIGIRIELSKHFFLKVLIFYFLLLCYITIGNGCNNVIAITEEKRRKHEHAG